ncbi:MAG: hypothetical protein SGBAC_005319 [Bacillariaceae sp.]
MDKLYSSVFEHYSALSSNGSKKPRIFLGIFSKYAHRKIEGKRRRVIRQTYLQYHLNANSTTDHRICSLPELLSTVLIPDECQMVYTFIFPNAKIMTKASTIENLLNNSSAGTSIEAKESDAVFFKLRSPNDEFEGIMKWIQWSTQIQSTIGNSLGQFDYLAYIDVGTMVYPHAFWGQNTIFQNYQPSVFAGMPKKKSGEDCQNSFCFDHRFTCVSQDLATYLASSTRPGVVEGGVGPNLLHYVKQYEASSGNEVSWLEVEGVRTIHGQPERHMNKWDSYLLSIRNSTSDDNSSVDEDYLHANITTYNGSARILVGIFTTNLKQLERKQRNMIRKAYLSAYKKSETPNRICSLQDMLKKKVKPDECQFAYTFVVGANSSAPTEQVDTDDLDLIAIPRDKMENPEPDMLYLNIRENMNNGKTETWFRYASLIVEHDLYFDYMAKMDTDTILFPYPLFRKMEKWPKYPNNRRIYGGEYNVKEDGQKRKDLLVGASYFNGPFYWISPDIARFITDAEKCNRTALRTSAEDMTIGNYINTFPHTIHRFQMSRKTYDHPFKDTVYFQKRWGRYKRKFKKFHKF